MLEHGGRLRAAAQQYGIPLNEWLDLSTGLAPWPFSFPAVPASVWQRLPEAEDGLASVSAQRYGAAQALPVAGAQAADRIIQLDAAQTIEAELSAQLPDDPQQAAVLVQRRLNERGHALQQQLREAYQGVTDAWSLGITSIPAVIVDQRYIVYGENELNRALARIEQHREGRP